MDKYNYTEKVNALDVDDFSKLVSTNTNVNTTVENFIKKLQLV